MREKYYVYLLNTEADHQESKIPFKDFRWIGSYIVEKALTNDNGLVRKVGTDKKQVHHCMRFRQPTPRQPKPDVQTTPREKNPDHEVIMKPEDLFARAEECEYKRPIFDNDHDNAAKLKSTDCPRKWVPFQESYQRVSQKCSFSQVDHVTERIRIIIWSLTPIRVRSSLSLLLPTPSLQSMIYVIIPSQTATMIRGTEFLIRPIWPTERIRTLSGKHRNVLGKWHATIPTHSSRLIKDFLV